MPAGLSRGGRGKVSGRGAGGARELGPAVGGTEWEQGEDEWSARRSSGRRGKRFGQRQL